ncbi:hypothetical protein ABEF95_007973 [Exophiala dermatitidis]
MKTRNPFAVCSLQRSMRHALLHIPRGPSSSSQASFRIRANIQSSIPTRTLGTSTSKSTQTPLRSSRYPTSSLSTRISSSARRHTSTTADSPASSSNPSRIVRPLVPPPKEGSGPLLSRRPDRALPELPRRSTWTYTLPIFVFLVGFSSVAIFNYQKSSSSTVNAILYALRTNEQARNLLGDEVYFASKVPWIRGELAPLQGTIDITFWVKGTRNEAQVKFVSIRKRRDGYFETLEWSLRTKDGEVIHLLDKEGSNDPMAGTKI